jgi:addiction module HigA family antidote
MPRPAIHPGEIMADELEDIGVTPTELSRQIAVPPNRITQIIQGKRAITGDTALRLGHWFRTSAQFWLNLQAAYDLRIAAKEVGRAVAKLPPRSTTGKTERKKQPASREFGRGTVHLLDLTQLIFRPNWRSQVGA